MKAGTINKPAADKEIENAEMKMDTYEQMRLCVNTSSCPVSPCLCSKIKSLNTPNKVWVIICADVKHKSTLQKMDVKCLFEAIKLAENMDATTHVTEMEAHFHLMQ